MKYRKKPIVIEARGPLTETELVTTAHGRVRAEVGDYILTDPATGDTWPIKPDILASTYEQMTDKAPAAPMKPPAAVSLRRVEELAWQFREVNGNSDLDTASALEALVRLVDALEEIAGPWPEAIPAESIYQCQEIARAALAQFVDDRKKP